MKQLLQCRGKPREHMLTDLVNVGIFSNSEQNSLEQGESSLLVSKGLQSKQQDDELLDIVNGTTTA